MIPNNGFPPQVALIGVSGYATVYVDWLLVAQKARLLRLVAISVLPAEQSLPQVKQLLEDGAELFDTYEELLAFSSQRIDLCYIPTGIQWHTRMAIAALRAGCNVLVEKPLAGSINDVDAVRQAERETERWIAVGFQDMYTDETAALKESLVAGIVGNVESIAMIGAWPRPEGYYLRNHWAGKLEADGSKVLDSPLNNAFAHFINLSLYLGSPEQDRSSTVTIDQANLYRAHKIESFDTAVVLGKSSDGVDFWFGVSHACQESIAPSIRINGSKGQINWTLEKRCEIIVDGAGKESRVVPNYDTTRRKMFENVLDRLHDPKARICDSSIARCHTRFIEQVHQSSEVATVADSLIDNMPLANSETTVPAIRGIEEKLQAAFQKLAPIESLEPNSLAPEQ